MEIESVTDEIDIVLTEINSIRASDNSSMLSSIAYSDMNSIPHDLDSCLYWMKLALESALVELKEMK